ncbi:MAG: hypothetical protein EXR72_24645 [Myxococcales bacterium]|nr:hypothetical protein [Myxococcales bacterium]
MPPENLALRPLLRAVRAVRRRMRGQAAVTAAATAAVPAGGVVLVSVYLIRLGALPSRAGLLVAALALVMVAAGALVAALRRIPPPSVAKRIDSSHGLSDRLGSALDFAARVEPTAFMQAAIADGCRAAQGIRPSLASPWRRPPHLAATALCLALTVLVSLLRFPSPTVAALPEAPVLPRLAIDRDLLEPERDLARDLQRQAETTGDEDLKEFAAQMNKLFDQLDRRELTRKELFDRLAELEQRAMKGDHGNFEELKQKLRKAGEELSKDALARATAEALKRDDLDKAKQEMEALAKKIDQQKADEKQQRALAKAMEQAAKEPAQTPEEKRAIEEVKKLEEEQRRLKREQQEKPKDEEVARRLQRNERRLEQLKREGQARADAQRMLQRLQRNMQSAASQMRDQNRAGATQAMRDAARELGKMQDEIRKLGNGRKMQSAVGELKELMRRMAGQGQDGQGQPPGEGQEGYALGEAQSGREGNPGKNGQNGQGDGKSGPEKQKLHDFLARAKGQGDPDGPKLLKPGQEGSDGQLLLPMGQGAQPGRDPGGQEQGHGPSQGAPGDRAGDSHDSRLTGDPTSLGGQRRALRAEGKMGAGPSKSETILGSAEKGFASAGYRRVYGDYTSVVEEVMSKEQVPPGYRFYVKRYFNLIKPRE